MNLLSFLLVLLASCTTGYFWIRFRQERKERRFVTGWYEHLREEVSSLLKRVGSTPTEDQVSPVWLSEQVLHKGTYVQFRPYNFISSTVYSYGRIRKTPGKATGYRYLVERETDGLKFLVVPGNLTRFG